jgi:hypothetical protein
VPDSRPTGRLLAAKRRALLRLLHRADTGVRMRAPGRSRRVRSRSVISAVRTTSTTRRVPSPLVSATPRTSGTPLPAALLMCAPGSTHRCPASPRADPEEYRLAQGSRIGRLATAPRGARLLAEQQRVSVAVTPVGDSRSTTSPSPMRTAVGATFAGRWNRPTPASTGSPATLRNEASRSSPASLPPRTSWGTTSR